jgi:UDP-N-acetylmuramoyl-L-alanyl-D-glutamate--2,6-diaminopimelate ligase
MLSELLTALDVRDTRGVLDLPVSNLAYHSEKVVPGSLFVCIRGFKTDGHNYLPRAVKNGACAAIVERFRNDVKIPQVRVENSRQALAVLADRFYDHPSKKIKVIGITATNGKTTTSFMTNAILEEHGLKTGLVGTVVIKVANTVRPAVLTTPESLDLHALFKQMAEQGVTHTTMEVSSSGLDLHRVDAVDFDIVTVNNISREHLDLHGSFGEYVAAKARLVREAKPHHWAILNLDCPETAALVDQTPARCLKYGLKNQSGNCKIHILDLSTGRARFTIELAESLQTGSSVIQAQQFPIELTVMGLHNVYNATVAALAGLLCGVPSRTIQRALKNFRGVERRFELIYKDDFMILDDHFANKGNIDVTLETLQFMEYRQLHLVYAIRGNRGPIVNRENARAIASWAKPLGLKEIIATTSNSHVTEKDTVTDQELAVFQEEMEAAGIKVSLYPELDDAISAGLNKAKPGDVLLLGGCQGMDHGARLALEFLHRKRPEVARDTLFKPLQNRVAGM